MNPAMPKLTNHFKSTKPSTATLREDNKCSLPSINPATRLYSSNNDADNKENVPQSGQRTALLPAIGRAPKTQLQHTRTALAHAPDPPNPYTLLSSKSTGALGHSPVSSIMPARRVLKEIQPNPTVVKRPSWVRLVGTAAPAPCPVSLAPSQPRITLLGTANNGSTQKPRVHRDVVEPLLADKKLPPPIGSTASHMAPHGKQRSLAITNSDMPKVPRHALAEEIRLVDRKTRGLSTMQHQRAVSPAKLLHQVDDQEDEEFERQSVSQRIPTEALTAKDVPPPLSKLQSLSSLPQPAPAPSSKPDTQRLPGKKRQRDWVTELRSEERRTLSSPRARLTTSLPTKRIKSEETKGVVSSNATAAAESASSVDSELVAQVSRIVAHGSTKMSQDQNRGQPPKAMGYCVHPSLPPASNRIIPPTAGTDARKTTILSDAEQVREGKHDVDHEEAVMREEWCAEYVDQVISHLYDREQDLAPPKSYWTKPREHWLTRATCIDAIVHLVDEFGAMDEVLFLAINYMDRFFAQREAMFDLEAMILISGICVWLALKFEAKQAAYPLQLILSRMKVYMQQPFARKDFIMGERIVLRELGYDLGWPGPIPFLNWACWTEGYPVRMQCMARFLLEIAPLFPALANQLPSLLVAAAMAVVRRAVGWIVWSGSYQDTLGYTREAVAPVYMNLIRILNEPRTLSSSSFRKYSRQERGYVANDLITAFEPHFQA